MVLCPRLKVEIFKKCNGPEQRSVLWLLQKGLGGRGVVFYSIVPSTRQIENLMQVLFKVQSLVIKEYLLL